MLYACPIFMIKNDKICPVSSLIGYGVFFFENGSCLPDPLGGVMYVLSYVLKEKLQRKKKFAVTKKLQLDVF